MFRSSYSSLFWRRCALTTAGVSPTLGVSTRHSSGGGKDYYKILGVSRSATPNEIKKAYRKRALETHPDQGGKKEDFAEVAEAYECLSNEEKRRVFDQYGSEAAAHMGAAGAGGMGGFGGRSAEDIFAEFFKGGMGGFGDAFGGMGGRRGPPQVPPIEIKLRLTLEEVYKGVSKTMRVNRPMVCDDCRGFGTKSQTKKPQCSHCGGSGHVVHSHRMGPGMVQQSVAQCPRCAGTGTLAKSDDQCTRCRGAGYRQVTQDVSIDIPAGVPSNVTLVVSGEGGTMPEVEPGDLHVNVEIAPHKHFKRRGNDILLSREVTLSEALLGTTMTVKMLDGRTMNVQVPHDTVLKAESVIKVPGEGMPSTNGGRGDVYITTHLKMPHKITKEQQTAIREAFGDPPEPSSSAEVTVKGRVMRETPQQLEETMHRQWDAQEGGSNRQSDGHGKQRGHRTECVHQ